MKKTALRGALATTAAVPLLLAGSGTAAAAEAEAFVLGPIAIITVTDIDEIPVVGGYPICIVGSVLPPVPAVPLFDPADPPATQRFLYSLTAAQELDLDEVDVEVACGLDITGITIDLSGNSSLGS